MIVDDDRLKLLKMYKMKVAGSVPSVLWELFGAILTGKKGAGGVGADLDGWEVKSAKDGGAYEYQYHLKTGLQKLKEDCEVNHLFCNYNKDYSRLEVRAIHGSDLADEYFKAWTPKYEANYDPTVDSAARRQRFRRNIPKGKVNELGVLILRIENGIVTHRDQEALDNF
ncbi:hypothetical protein CWI69_00820 [Pseudidiomarina halophila]|uniref:Uncharacterized protein n=1 Tax=Pseudidiomarina halophila TaxID=1449799 RepID=A0A432Y1W1_9GAMM|nr:hypothetical protein CWI69_00820 [Pseudidiomarina halophila]